MSEATAIGRLPDYTSSRRWQRYKVNVPIRVIVCRAMRASIFDGRGTSLSEGGMALFAGAELRPEIPQRHRARRRFRLRKRAQPDLPRERVRHARPGL